jgi:DNA polymerase-3 subunit epsilon
LTEEFLRDHPCFEEVAEAFAEFIGDSHLIAHNAMFDRGFINMELGLCKRPAIGDHRFIDTLMLARRRHPNGPNSLDALCARYGIDNSARTQHGALLDAHILAEVYLELMGGRQASFLLDSSIRVSVGTAVQSRPVAVRPRPIPSRLSAEDAVAHQTFIAGLEGQPLWARYRVDPAPPPS